MTKGRIMKNLSYDIDDIDDRIANNEKLLKQTEKKLEYIEYLLEKINKDNLTKKFNKGEKPDGFSWTLERAMSMRKCKASGKIIWPGEKAYKGSKYLPPAPMEYILRNVSSAGIEIWVSKGEYLIRKLKDQI